MGENAAETVKEIEDTRDRLERRLDLLERRMPLAAAARWGLRIAAGGGLAGSLVWLAVRRARRNASPTAAPAPTGPVPPVEVSVHLLPEAWIRALETDRGKVTAATLAAAWMLLRLAALRR